MSDEPGTESPVVCRDGIFQFRCRFRSRPLENETVEYPAQNYAFRLKVDVMMVKLRFWETYGWIYSMTYSRHGTSSNAQNIISNFKKKETPIPYAMQRKTFSHFQMCFMLHSYPK